ncbi:MAG: phycobilisome rod-core linker polypeptide [Vulcanococcus sp.]
MSLVNAPPLGIERFTNGQNKEHWRQASDSDKRSIIRAVYQQLLGGQYLMSSERLGGAESLFLNGDLNVRELVRTLAKSALYRARFFESCNPYRFIELNHKHLLGRAPHNKEEMLHHFTILQEQGYEAEIDSYIDSPEYSRNFGNDTVPHLHGWAYSAGHEGRQFSWLMQLARGAAASAKGDGTGNGKGSPFKLGPALHQNRAIPVSAPTAAARYPHISTDGPFRASMASSNDLPNGDLASNRRIDGTSAYAFRSQELVVSAPSAGAASDGSRVVTITATGIANNRFVRHGSYTTRVPYSRMNEALQRVIRQGGKVMSVVVSGDRLDATATAASRTEQPQTQSQTQHKPRAKAKSKAKQG